MNTQRKVKQLKNRWGQRTPTISDRAIIAHIKEHPGLTAQEYADILSIRAREVHDAILFTKEGLSLAENNQIVVARRGRTPIWANYIKKDHVILRDPENQLTPKIMPKMAKNVPAMIRSEMTNRAHLFAETVRCTNPSRRSQLLDQINVIMNSDVQALQEKDRQIEALMKKVDDLVGRFDTAVNALKVQAGMVMSLPTPRKVRKTA